MYDLTTAGTDFLDSDRAAWYNHVTSRPWPWCRGPVGSQVRPEALLRPPAGPVSPGRTRRLISDPDDEKADRWLA